MAAAPLTGVLGQLSVLEVQARNLRNAPQQKSRLVGLRAEVEALRLHKAKLEAEIHTQQTLQKLRDKRNSLEEEGEGEEEKVDEDSENSELLELMVHHTRLKDLLRAHHLIGGYDVTKINGGKGVCVAIATAYEGVSLDTYNLEMDLKPALRIGRHNIPPFIPLGSLAEQSHMQKDIRAFLETLSRHLNAFAGRKQQLKLIKEQHQSVEVLESNVLCSLLVLNFTEARTKTDILCTLDYSDYTRCLPTVVKFESDVKEVLASRDWSRNCNLLTETPLHEALSTMKRMGNIL